MPTIQELTDKWFIDTSKSGGYPPQKHHPGSTISNFTTGNAVTPLIDGATMMDEWYQRANSLLATPNQSELMHAGWVIADIELVKGTAASKTSTLFEKLEDDGVGTYLAFSDHLTNKGHNEDFVEDLEFATACVDTRYAIGGSLHQKFSVFKTPTSDSAIVGSADLWLVARDTSAHTDRRWHEVSVLLEGPAVADVEKVFRQRWNDVTRDYSIGNLTQPDDFPDSTPDTIGSRTANATGSGSHGVQVLQTYGRSKTSYSWANAGEFTVWASYLNAIQKAEEYIYIEDQYFVPMGYPPRCEKPPRDQKNGHIDAGDYDPWSDTVQKASPFYQLGEALKDGVDVIVIANRHIADGGVLFEEPAKHLRKLGAAYLQEIVDTEQDAGDLYIGYLATDGYLVKTHSKLLLVDDEFASLGSANFNRRSFTCDGELQLGIVDEQGAFVRDLRKDLWHNHSGVSKSQLTDPTGGREKFKQAMDDGDGKLTRFSISTDVGEPPTLMGKRVHNYDPYRGPLGV